MTDDPREPPADVEPAVTLGRRLGRATSEWLALGEGTDLRDHPDLPRGSTVGRFTILGRVAVSEADVVYAAFDPDEERKVAIKLVRVAVTGEDENEEAARLRVLDEARALANLSHPCAARVLEVGVLDDRVYLVMEFLDGIDLDKWMAARDEPFPWPEVLRVFREAGRGLAAAHKVRIVHRNFNPRSVMICKGGRICVLDFGLARSEAPSTRSDADISELKHSFPGDVSTPSDRPASITRSGNTLGNPRYMAPEVHIAGRADERSDQFSFCVTLYEALYGERPFKGSRPIAMAIAAVKQQVRPVPRGSDVPEWLRAVVLKGLHPRPEERHASMEALLRELASDPRASRRRWLVGSAVVVALGTGGAILARQVEAENAACARDRSALDGVWDRDVRVRLERSFAASGRPWSTEVFATTVDRLDRFTDEWLDLAQAACVATHVRHDADEALYVARVDCLDRSLQQVRAVDRVMIGGDPALLDGAAAALSRLTSPRNCTLNAELEARGSPRDAEQARALAADLADAELRLRAGVLDGALVRAQGLIEKSMGLDFVALAVDVQLHHAAVLQALSQPEDAAEAYQAAAVAALRADLEYPLAEAWIGHGALAAAQGQTREARHLLEGATALVDRRQYDRLRPSLARSWGDTALADARPTEALKHYYKALGLEDRRDDSDPLRRVPLWIDIARILTRQGDTQTALSHLQEALSVIHAAMGPRHPDNAPVLAVLMDAQLAAGDAPAAIASGRRALDVISLAPERAGQGIDAALRLGEILLREGRHLEAIEVFDVAERALTKEPSGAVHRFRARLGRGIALLALDDVPAATLALRQAIDLGTVAGPRALADARFALARVLVQDEATRAEAVELARQAKDAYAGLDRSEGTTAKTMSEVQRWLAEHDVAEAAVAPADAEIPADDAPAPAEDHGAHGGAAPGVAEGVPP